MGNKEKGGAALWTIAGIGGVIALVTVVPLLLALLGIINLPFLKLQSKVALNRGVVTKTYDTTYCLNNYEWFKQTYQDIQQSDVQIQSVQAQIDDFKKTYGTDASKWNFAATQQYGQISASLTGLQNYKADLVGQYNARTQELNRVACKDLPLYVRPLGDNMLPIFIIIWILESLANSTAIQLWHWFGSHLVLIILMLIFLA